MSRYERWNTRIARLETHSSENNPINVDLKGDYSFIVNKDEKRHYIPYPTIRGFHQSNCRRRLLLGPFASGKTTGCMAEVILRACLMPKWYKNGVRRSKWAFVRNTAGQLETTTLQTWLNWFDDLDYDKPRRNKKPVLTYNHRFKDNEGWVEIEVIFLALDNPDDIKKLKSLDLTAVYINELSEIPHSIFEVLNGRVGRYPIMSNDYAYWRGIIADTNPPKIGSWIYNDFFFEPLDGHQLFKQPPALLPNPDKNGYKWINNPLAENNRMGDYWLEQSIGATEEYVKVFCLGEFGTISAGKLVYPEYNDDIHSKPDLETIGKQPISLFFDFGLTPACIIIQPSHTGQLRCLREVCADSIMGLRQFLEVQVIPVLNRYFGGLEVEWVGGDPAGNIRVDTDQNNCFNILQEYWPRHCEPCITNKIENRLEAVRFGLGQLIGGQPMLIISREGCPILRTGFLGEYIFKMLRVTGERRYQEEPYKNEYSHIQDALQYGMVYFTNLSAAARYQVDTSKLINRGLRF